MIFQNLPSSFHLDFKHVSLGTPYPEGVTLLYLEQLADFECSSLLKKKSLIPDYLGNSILRHQIYKSFCPNTEYQIFLRSNIYDFIEIINNITRLERIEIPFKLENIDSIYDFLNATLSLTSESNYYIIDYWGLDYSRINNSNLIIFSSIENLFGISGINLCWAAVPSPQTKLSKLISEKLSILGPSTSFLSEIYSIIALRNRALIDSQNNIYISANRKTLEDFSNKNDFYKLKISNVYLCALLQSKKSDIIDHEKIALSLKKKHSLVLSYSYDTNEPYIFYGKKAFKGEFKVLENALKEIEI